MDTEDSTALAGVEAADDSAETQETEVNEELESEVTEGQDGDGEEGEAEEIEFDFGGNKLRVPKNQLPEELAGKVQEFAKNIWGDYTRKSQENAESKKSLEARERAIEKLTSLNGEALQTYSRGLAVREELAQLAQIDLNKLWQSNPDDARRVSDRISQKQAEFNSIVQQVNQKEQELSTAQQAETARRAEEGKQLVERRIKGFSEKDLTEYAVKSGIPQEDAGKWALNPVVTEAFWKAMLYDRMQANAKKPAPKVQAEPVKPMKAKGAATSGSLDLVKDADKLSADEWARRRNEQVRKRGYR